MSANSHAFENDIPLDKVKNLGGEKTVSNLQVGERVYINYYSLCWNADGLQLSPHGSIVEGGNGRYALSFVLKSANKGEIEIPSVILNPALIAISRRTSCEVWEDVEHHKAQYIEIQTINGKSKISELFP
jgi:hypothetical protein